MFFRCPRLLLLVGELRRRDEFPATAFPATLVHDQFPKFHGGESCRNEIKLSIDNWQNVRSGCATSEIGEVGRARRTLGADSLCGWLLFRTKYGKLEWCVYVPAYTSTVITGLHSVPAANHSSHLCQWPIISTHTSSSLGRHRFSDVTILATPLGLRNSENGFDVI